MSGNVYWSLLGSVAGTLMALSFIAMHMFYSELSLANKQVGAGRSTISPVFGMALDAVVLYFIPFSLSATHTALSSYMVYLLGPVLAGSLVAAWVATPPDSLSRALTGVTTTVGVLALASMVSKDLGVVFALANQHADLVAASSLVAALGGTVLTLHQSSTHRWVYVRTPQSVATVANSTQLVDDRVNEIERRLKVLTVQQNTADELSRLKAEGEELKRLAEPMAKARFRYSQFEELIACKERFSKAADDCDRHLDIVESQMKSTALEQERIARRGVDPSSSTQLLGAPGAGGANG